MFPKEIEFSLDKRVNRFAKNGADYSLGVRFGRSDLWSIVTWDTEPSKETVNTMKEVIIRAMETYHNQLTVPSFSIKRI